MTATAALEAAVGVPESRHTVLEVENLTVDVGTPYGRRAVVRDLSFTVAHGETLCIAGESGSGKSMTSLAIMGLLPRPTARIASGSIRLGGRELTRLGEGEMRAVRGDRIAMIFQEPMTSLNPVLTIGRQLTEAIRAHRSVSAGEARRLAVEALEAVRMPQAAARLDRYAHEMSGGQRQRVMIAIALALRPDLLIADEPTTALDVTVQAQVLSLLRDLQRETGTAVILITHDMGVVAEMSDRVVLMRHGEAVEGAPTQRLFRAPASAYARELLAAVPRIGEGAARRQTVPAVTERDEPVVAVSDLRVRFPTASNWFGRPVADLHAVGGISFRIAPGETLSLVGESGCGKSTTAKALAGLVPFEGDIVVAGRNAGELDRAGRKAMRRDVQMVFQDPYASLDPRMTAGDLVGEPLVIHRIETTAERRERVASLFERVGLSPDQMGRYPHEFSGGQRQRLSIARALSLGPKLIIADESVSALDVSVQRRVLDLLQELQAERGVSYLFISHDMAVVENISDRVAVMYGGQIVETGSRDQVFGSPHHPYTRRLIEAVPVPDPTRRRRAFAPMNEAHPDLVHARGTRPNAVQLREVAPGHWSAAA
ncbi:ABC transporter ATP-binding protein [Aureimonas jatrophae]|uniref:Peptide/nickel transport system ATP-binding protein n=1 Tax=Aureimonas jatrophae TaxID=1166073 RepID=A0A1H0D049_9HYPH|nr:ABC transporter ATP-binding protein [Aureimonas jatrophae]MBB3949436.1 peptide/nickel transport system ATP-binding protein [Aureimonas jatrophae]SDN63547.1 peptide/nickel transport system ATP-binding protein [Aureimonas jatrophae]